MNGIQPADSRQILVRRKKQFRKRMLFAVIGCILFAIVARHIDWTDLGATISRADWRILGLAVCLGFATTVARAARFCAFFQSFHRLLPTVGAFGVLRAIQYVLPFRGGEVVALGLFRRLGLSPGVAETLPVWVLFRLSELVVVATLFIAICLTEVTLLEMVRQSLVLWGGIILGAWLVVVFSPRILVLFLQRASIRGQFGQSQMVQSLAAGLERVRGWKLTALLHGSSLLIWSANIGCLTLGLFALNPPFGLSACATVIVAMLGVGLIPIRAPMGLGTGDATVVGMLRIYDLPMEHAVSLAMGVRLVQMAVVGLDAVVGGLILLATRRTV